MTNSNKMALILDRDKALVDELAARCKSIGMEVRTAYDPVTAVKIMESEFPDLFIVDLEMPARRDMTFLEVLDSQPESRNASVIVLCKPELELDRARRFISIFAYYVHKSSQAWKKIETFAFELVDLDPGLTQAQDTSESF